MQDKIRKKRVLQKRKIQMNAILYTQDHQQSNADPSILNCPHTTKPKEKHSPVLQEGTEPVVESLTSGKTAGVDYTHKELIQRRGLTLPWGHALW